MKRVVRMRTLKELVRSVSFRFLKGPVFILKLKVELVRIGVEANA